MKLRILFVDDEPKVLQGLVRMLHSKRHEWEIFTAGGGQEALDLLSFDGTGIPVDAVKKEEIPLGARILKVALGFDTLQSAGETKSRAIAQLKQRPGWYDPKVLTALEAVIWIEGKYQVQVIPLGDLQDNMILDDDVWTTTGTLLIAKGQEVNQLIRRRLHDFAENVGVKEPLQVLVPPN